MLDRLARCRTIVCTIVLSLAAIATVFGKSPWTDATAVWQMNDSQNTSGKGGPLAIHGNVRLGVAIITKNDIIDTCIDGRRTMITRRDPEPDGDRLFVFARGGEVSFEDVTIRLLLDQ